MQVRVKNACVNVNVNKMHGCVKVLVIVSDDDDGIGGGWHRL